MYTASRAPWWDEKRLATLVADIAPQGVDRAVRRYQNKIAEHIHSDARIEGNTFTLPEVQTLLHGHHVAGHTEGEANMIEDMRVASDDLTEKVQAGPLELSQGLSDDLHILLARHSEIPSLEMRADWPGRNAGPQVGLGGGVRFQSLPRGEVRAVFEDGLRTISNIENPVQRAATWAAFATYHQFYWDGNKRTGRYVMNAIAMSYGYDSISIPNSKSTDYLEAALLSYKTADLTPHIRFLLEQYDDH